jgi:hypothetical protein
LTASLLLVQGTVRSTADFRWKNRASEELENGQESGVSNWRQ